MDQPSHDLRSRRRAPRAGSGSTWVCVMGGAIGVFVALTAGCDESGAPSDGGTVLYDAYRIVEEAGLVYHDATLVDAATPPDAAPPSTDTSSPSVCAGTCDPTDATSCAPGEVCVLDGAEPRCVTTAGVLARGMPCVTVSDCRGGLGCFRAASGAVQGVCDVPCCPGDTGTCSGVSLCGGERTLVDGTATSFGRCVNPQTCSLLDSASCHAGEGCYVLSADGATECRTAGTIAEGQTCDTASSCAPGLLCVGLDQRVCVRVCAIADGDADCATGERCQRQAYTPYDAGVCVMTQAARQNGAQ